MLESLNIKFLIFLPLLPLQKRGREKEKREGGGDRERVGGRREGRKLISSLYQQREIPGTRCYIAVYSHFLLPLRLLPPFSHPAPPRQSSSPLTEHPQPGDIPAPSPLGRVAFRPYLTSSPFFPHGYRQFCLLNPTVNPSFSM